MNLYIKINNTHKQTCSPFSLLNDYNYSHTVLLLCVYMCVYTQCIYLCMSKDVQ